MFGKTCLIPYFCIQMSKYQFRTVFPLTLRYLIFQLISPKYKYNDSEALRQVF